MYILRLHFLNHIRFYAQLKTQMEHVKPRYCVLQSHCALFNTDNTKYVLKSGKFICKQERGIRFKLCNK